MNSVIGNVFKIAGTVIEGAGRTIVDCTKAIEESNKEYYKSEQYAKDRAERQKYIDSMKNSWKRIRGENFK
jgi:hypothetical protein